MTASDVCDILCAGGWNPESVFKAPVAILAGWLEDHGHEGAARWVEAAGNGRLVRDAAFAKSASDPDRRRAIRAYVESFADALGWRGVQVLAGRMSPPTVWRVPAGSGGFADLEHAVRLAEMVENNAVLMPITTQAGVELVPPPGPRTVYLLMRDLMPGDRENEVVGVYESEADARAEAARLRAMHNRPGQEDNTPFRHAEFEVVPAGS